MGLKPSRNRIELHHMQIADFTNNSGIILFEGNDLTQDIVCGIDTSFSRNINMQSNSIGCENDEARSILFSDIAAGTLITLYDSPSRSKEDDFVIIYIKRYIGSMYDGQAHYVGTFETDVINNEYISMDFYRNNGLDGKLSYITIELNANPYGNSQIILYEGTSASQNIVCTVPLNSDRFINFKSDGYVCDNDEAKSLIITIYMLPMNLRICEFLHLRITIYIFRNYLINMNGIIEIELHHIQTLLNGSTIHGLLLWRLIN